MNKKMTCPNCECSIVLKAELQLLVFGKYTCKSCSKRVTSHDGFRKTIPWSFFIMLTGFLCFLLNEKSISLTYGLSLFVFLFIFHIIILKKTINLIIIEKNSNNNSRTKCRPILGALLLIIGVCMENISLILLFSIPGIALIISNLIIEKRKD